MTTLRRKLNEIFTKVQTGPTQIPLKRLQNLYHESDFNDFLKEFLKYINVVLKTKNDQDHYRDKLLIFASKFCTSLNKASDDSENICPFLKEIFLHLFKEYNPDVISTFRVCQFIKLLLKEIGDQESFLDEDICIQIRDLMLEHIDDVKARVRIQAIEVLQKLQEPLDYNDVIIKAFIDRIFDDNSQVRKHIVQCIGLNIISIPVIVGRCLDISDEVRLVSYDKLSKITVKALKIEQRQFILRNGFADKSPKIKNFIIKNVLPQWLSTYSGDFFQLIRVLKLDADEKDFKQTTTLVEKVLEELFKNTEITTIMEALPLGKEKLISSGEVQWEEILFWRCLQQFLRNEESDNDYVEKILPELIFFCDYVTEVFKSKSQLKSDWELVQHDHIMFELLKICYDYDYSDEVGRNALQNLLTTMLIDGPAMYDVIMLLVQMFEKLIPDIEERAVKFCEIIAEIQTPLTPVAPSDDLIRKRDVKLAELRCKLNIAEDKLDTAIDKADYDKASELKKEIATIREKMAEISKEFDNANLQRTPKTDTSTLCRCLDILTASLQNPNIKSLPESYRAFQDIFLPPLLTSRQPEVVWRTLKQICLFANFDLKLAKESVKAFTTPLVAHKFRPNYGDQTTVVAINCITDIILIHGSDVFGDKEEENTLSLSQRPTNRRKLMDRSDRTAIDETIYSESPLSSLELVIEALSELVDDTDDKIRETAGECLITLILTGRIRSALLFSKLLLKWFSPNTYKDVRLRQMIGRLFTDYVPVSPYSLEVIEQAFVPTLQAIIDAPKASPLADIDVESVSRFLAALSQPGRHKYNAGLDAHKNIALILCREICDHPNTKGTHIYLKTLMYLEVPREDEVTLDILRKQVDTMQELIKEKQCLRYVFKYRHKLDDDLTHNDNTTSATSVNSALPETTNNRVVTETHNNTVETQKDDTETSRYSSLSVKRKKRQSRENGEQAQINGSIPSRNISVQLNRDVEIEKICTRIVVSETDSEYATETDLPEHKKKHHRNVPEKIIVEALVHTEDTVNMCSQTARTNSEATENHCQEVEKNLPTSKPEEELVVQLVRNKEIDKMCSKMVKDLEKHEKKHHCNVPEKIIVEALVHTEDIVNVCSQIATTSSEATKNHCQEVEKNLPTSKPEKELVVQLVRNKEIDKMSSKMVKDLEKHKKELANTAEKQLNVHLVRNKQIERRCSQRNKNKTECDTENNLKEEKTKINTRSTKTREISVLIERNTKIEKNCTSKAKTNTKTSRRKRRNRNR